jgi:outer membrane protein OmpA-like peptidoglycan-associated protein
MKPSAKLWALTAVAATLVACGTTPQPNSQLDAARSAVQQARSNPYAARSAAVELDRAQEALQRAESAWSGRGEPEDVTHLAYLAQRRAEVALAIATQAQSDERVQQAGGERERVRLEARTREAEAAGASARSAQAQAQSAQANAAAAQASARSAQTQVAQSREEAEAARRQAAEQAERATALERDLQSLQGRQTNRGMVVTLGDVLFATGQATLQPGAQRSVQQLATVMQQYPERRVLIEGFTDSQGSDEMNLELSRRRAEAFRSALLQSGVSQERIEVRAHGEGFPVADNGTPAGRQQNRRVEVLFSDGQGRFAAR